MPFVPSPPWHRLYSHLGQHCQSTPSKTHHYNAPNLGCHIPIDCQKSTKAHHLTRLITHIPAIDVLRHHTAVWLTLDVDFFDASTINEIIHIAASPRLCNGIIDRCQRYAISGCLCLIDVNFSLGASS